MPMIQHTVDTRFHRIMRWALRVSAVLLILSGTGLAGAYYAYEKDLPSEQELLAWRPPQATRIYDRRGTLLYEIYGEQKRVVVPESAISPYLKQATVAIEDARFYDHRGVDPRGIARAFVTNIQAGSSVEGGSTITQQLAKNTFLTPKRTLDRKVREAFLALRIERHFSKDKILELYLNQVGYGANAYGAEAAANMYYGKSAHQLSLSEAATLAALTKSPTHYSPYGSNKDRLTHRRNLVLDRMVEHGYVSADDAEKAKAETIAVKPRTEDIKAPHFVMYVKEQLVEKYGKELVETGGLEVTTTLDLEKQQLAEKIAAEAEAHLGRAGARNMALVALNPRNGEVLAMLGSRDYFNTSQDGNVNVATSHRPPGSAFKPIVYGAAFDQGPWAPGSTVFDLETNFGDTRFPYIPNNYDEKFHGPVSARSALANSYNVPAVKMMALIGKEKTLETAQSLGISTLTDPNKYGLSLVLGGGDVTLLELSGAYGAFANQGTFHKPFAISRITQGEKVLFEQSLAPKPVLKPQAAYQINSILSDNAARTPVFGPRSPLYIEGRVVAAKTGTTQDYRDAWTVGYTPSLVVGVWVGNNDFSPMRQGSAGAMAAAPLWQRFMKESLASLPNETFQAPEGLEVLTVDAITGKRPTSGTRETRQDIFAAWQRPSDAQLASYTIYACDGAVKESKNYPAVHSEQPNNPEWEKPVQAWARGHGYASTGRGDVRETCEPSPPVELVQTEPPAVGGEGEPTTPIVEPVVVTPAPTPLPTPIIVPTPEPVATPEPPEPDEEEEEDETEDNEDPPGNGDDRGGRRHNDA